MKPLEYFVGKTAHVRHTAGKAARNVSMNYETFLVQLRDGTWDVVRERANLRRLTDALAQGNLLQRTRDVTASLRQALAAIAEAAT